MNGEELKEAARDARCALERKRECLRESYEELEGFSRTLEKVENVLAENERLQEEIERLNNLLEQKQAENDSLRMQLVEVKEQKLKAEEERADAHPKATEIHNHFEPGSSAQVFNDRVTGKFTKKRRWKEIIKKNK